MSWTMARLDREARKQIAKTGSKTNTRVALVALRGHPRR
jgi:hypothetical protein